MKSRRVVVFALMVALVITSTTGSTLAKPGKDKGKRAKKPYRFVGTIENITADALTDEVIDITVNVRRANKAAQPYANPLPLQKKFVVKPRTKVEVDGEEASLAALETGQEVEVRYKMVTGANPQGSAAHAVKAKSVPEGSPPPGTDSGRMTFAHQMVCCPAVNTLDVAAFKQEIQQAQAAGIDGFGLNAGSWNADGSGDTYYRDRVDMYYRAAEELDSNFKLFLSADMCCGNSLTDVKDMVDRYFDSPAQMKVDGKAFLSTFSGEHHSFGYRDPTTGWKQGVLDALAAEGKPVYFVPFFYATGYPEYPTLDQWRALYDTFPYLDGLFYFSALADANGANKAVASNRAGKQASDERGKIFMAGAVPNYSPHQLNNHRTGKYGGYQAYKQVWENIIADSPQYVEVVTWSDWGEGSYVGPRNTYFARSKPGSWEHNGYLDLTSYYSEKFEKGTYPPLRDKIYLSHRQHPKDAVATNDLAPKPYGSENQTDTLWAIAHLASAAKVCLVSGTVTSCQELAAGEHTLSVPMKVGTQRAYITRNGMTIRNLTSPVQVTASPTVYNFNHYAGVDAG